MHEGWQRGGKGKRKAGEEGEKVSIEEGKKEEGKRVSIDEGKSCMRCDKGKTGETVALGVRGMADQRRGGKSARRGVE